ncbi:MAG TPA: hypothetical protein VNR60_03980 [Croceibacterium sp.]|nr:hypothetical protein [Croceibacterium sp.]
MSGEVVVKPHDLAAGKIYGWRGRCIDFFARGERTVAATLEAVCEKDTSLKIGHLAGQRLSDLRKIVEIDSNATKRQQKIALQALNDWQKVEVRRPYFSHGVVTVLIERNSDWHVRLDFTKYQGKTREPQSWSCSVVEAQQFEAELECAFKNLSSQLGQFRKRLSA